MKQVLLFFCLTFGWLMVWAQETDELVFNQLTINDGLASNDVQVIRQDRYRRLWIGTSRGVDACSTSHWKVVI